MSSTIGGLRADANASEERASVSIRVHGGNIGAIKRSTLDVETGLKTVFVSGYANASVPNLWNAGEAA